MPDRPIPSNKEWAVICRLLNVWGGLSKAMGLHIKRNGELSDYDDELASDVYEAAQATLQWRDGNGDWVNFPFRNGKRK